MTTNPPRNDPAVSKQAGSFDRRYHGRRQGRPLRAAQSRLLAETLPRLRIDLPPAGPIDLATLFPVMPDDIWLEVGFGGGEHLAWQAEAHPGVGMIGCEPFVNGVVSLLGHLDRRGLGNVRIYDDEARALLAALPAASIGRVFVLFSDPWPKARHAKRRFIATDTLALLARILKDGAELRLATDDPGLLVWSLEQTRACPEFLWPLEGPQDWRSRPADWPATRYEEKARLQGRTSTYLRLVRRPRHLEMP